MTSGKPLTCETHWSSIQRPRYSPGLLLEDEDLNTGVAYTQALMALMLKSLFGCGVICGLKVSAVPTCKDTKRRIDVTKGIALDGEGNLIEVAKSWQFEFGPDCNDGFPLNLWVVLCYTESCCRPKDVACESDDEGTSKPTRVRAGFTIKVQDHPPKCACSCGPAEDDTDDEGSHGHGCCHGSATRRHVGGQEDEDDETPADPCACYLDHFNGECGCECACRCVVLAKIVDPKTIVHTDEDGNEIPPYIKVDSSMVRRVRPVLNGYLQCLCPTGIACATPPQQDDDNNDEDTQAERTGELLQKQRDAAEARRLKAAKVKAAKAATDQVGNG